MMNSKILGDRVLRYSALAILIAGVCLRINQYAVNRSLWLDEAMLALNIVNRSFWDLLRPLDYSQGAPLGFLIIQKFMVTFFGGEDFVLRIFPLMAAIGSLYLMYRVSVRYVGGIGALIALGLFSFSGRIIYYASENKQYSTDVLCSLILLLSVGKCLEKDAKSSDYFLLCLLGVISIFFSHPVLFILSGVAAGLLLNGFVTKDGKKWRWMGWTFLIWLISYIILYFISLRMLASNASLLNYWQNAFMPWPPWTAPSWFMKTFLSVLKDPAGLANHPFFILLLMMAGSVSLFYRQRPLVPVLIVPFIAVLFASGFHKYPVSGRLLLFLIPLIYLLIAEAVEGIRLLLNKLNPWVSWTCWILIIVYIFIHPVSQGISSIGNPEMGEHIKPVLDYVQKNKSDGDLVYVYYSAWPAFSFYAEKYGFKEKDAIQGIRSRQEPEKYIYDIERFAGKARIWLIVSHNCFWCRVNEEKFIVHSLGSRGTLVKEFKAPGASVYVYDF